MNLSTVGRSFRTGTAPKFETALYERNSSGVPWAAHENRALPAKAAFQLCTYSWVREVPCEPVVVSGLVVCNVANVEYGERVAEIKSSVGTTGKKSHSEWKPLFTATFNIDDITNFFLLWDFWWSLRDQPCETKSFHQVISSQTFLSEWHSSWQWWLQLKQWASDPKITVVFDAIWLHKDITANCFIQG